MQGDSRAERIEREVAAQAGIPVIAEEVAGGVALHGRVATAEARQAAEDVARAMAPGVRIDNELEVDAPVPSTIETFTLSDTGSGRPPGSVAELHEEGAELEGDFTAAPTSTSGLENSGVDTMEDAAEVYFPPTDPVVRPGPSGEPQVLGGFSATSMDTVEVEPSALDGQPGDEAIADAVRRELAEDATTTDLEVDVLVRNRVVYLRGPVSGPEDIENAEAVAGRVPGVRDVVEELTLPE